MSRQVFEEASVEADRSGPWDILRAASGLVIVAGLLLLLLVGAWADTLSRSRSIDPPTRRESAAPLAPPRDNLVLYQAADRWMLYYVVGTREEAETATRLQTVADGEALEALARGDQPPYWVATILYARDGEELAVAARTVFNALVENGGARIQVIDLRGGDVSPTAHDVIQGLVER